MPDLLGSSTNFQFPHFTTMRLSVLCWFFADAAGLRRHQSFAPARPRSRLTALALPLMLWMQPAIAAYSCCAREAAAARGWRCDCCCAVAVAIVACRLRTAVRARRAAAMCRLPPPLSSSTNGAYGGAVAVAVRRLSPSLPAHALCALACYIARLAPSLLCRLSPSRRRLRAARSMWRRCCCARPDALVASPPTRFSACKACCCARL